MVSSLFIPVFCLLALTSHVLSEDWNVEGMETMQTATPASLKESVAHLKKQYGGRYRLPEKVARKLKSLDANASQQDVLLVARDVLIAHPLLKKHRLLVTTRHQYPLDHHNTATMFQKGEINENKYTPGGDLKLVDLAQGKASVILAAGEKGLIRDPDVHYNGDKILFSWRRNQEDGFHVYEINADGGGVRQLTSLSGISDIDPVYLPDGGIMFSSTRQPKFCMCNRHIMVNLYRMEADGANPHPVGRSTLFEGHSVVLDDGRILYDRWEYVDRNFGDAQGLWTVNPDGTNHAIYWGNNTKSPGGVIDARPIPGTDKILAVLASCHDRPWGALGIIERSKGLDGPEPVEKTWPADYRQYIMTEGREWYDSPKQRVKLRYEDPYPLDNCFFLASRALNPGKYGEKTGIFLLDMFGNEILLYAEASNLGSYDPMLLKPRQKQRVRPSTIDLSQKTGTFFVQNVYEGTHMQGVAPGEIKYLRIVESPEKRTWTRQGWNGQGEQAPAVNWHSFENKRILGIVPVERDGSASFEVPADRFVYFQALDADGRMVQSMRSGTIVRPGENQGCIGCHDNRLSAPPTAPGVALAGKRVPSRLVKNGNDLFNYKKDVQPIWDRHCVSCHDFGKSAGGKLNLCGDPVMPFNVSYTELWGRGYLSCVGGGPAEIRPAKSWGSLKSKLVQVIKAGHQGVKLAPDEMAAIQTWIDLNGVYYPYYDSSYPDGVFGRGPLTPAEYGQLQKLSGGRLTRESSSRGKVWISLSRPELSPILKEVTPEAAAEITRLLEKGRQRLEACPRADMEGFRPSSWCVRQLGKYADLEAAENKVRQAMEEGSKLYDRDLK